MNVIKTSLLLSCAKQLSNTRNTVPLRLMDFIRKFYFITPNNGVGIAVPTDERVIRIEYRDYTATIHGVDNPANIQLYALGGKRIAAATSSDGTAVTVSLSSLAPGIYILDIDGKQSFKLLKR